MKDLWLDSKNDPLSKDVIMQKINDSPISIFRNDSTQCTEDMFSKVELLGVEDHIIKPYNAIYVAYIQRTEDAIFQEIANILRDNRLDSLIVLNREQIVEALREYCENHKITGS